MLALSQHDVRLYYGAASSVLEVDLGETPRNLADALRYDTPDAQVTFHGSARPVARAVPAAPCGMATRTSDRHPRSRRLPLFEAGQRRRAPDLGEQTTPLILAGVEYERASYRQANSYPYLVEAGIEGNPKLLSQADLHAPRFADCRASLRAADGRRTGTLSGARGHRVRKLRTTRK